MKVLLINGSPKKAGCTFTALNEVAKSLNALAQGRTTITIAHRLSSIKNSDRILVLTCDGIAESGPHDFLMREHGIYAKFYTMADRLK